MKYRGRECLVRKKSSEHLVQIIKTGAVAIGITPCSPHQTSENMVIQSGRGVMAMLWIMTWPEGQIW
jgi:hypothetical protein